jgi:hypothetical protein
MADPTSAPAVTPEATEAEPPAATLSQRDLLIVAAGALVVINVAFLLLGRMYYAD